MPTREKPAVLELDVRPALARGEEPFPLIMEAKRRLQPGQALHLIAPFEPLPLLAHFHAAGYAADSRKAAPGEWHVRFTPESRPAASGRRELDLRELDPPGPLQKGLEAAAALGREETLVLHTRFHPVHLFEELAGGGYDWETEESAAMHWVTHIWRVTTP